MARPTRGTREREGELGGGDPVSSTDQPDERPARIVISTEDLNTEPPRAAPPYQVPQGIPNSAWPSRPPPPPPPPPTERLPGLGPNQSPLNVPYGYQTGGYPGAKAMTFDQVLTKAGSNIILSGLIAGGLGGFIGWVFSEVISNPDSWSPQSKVQLDVDTGLWFMLFGLFLGFVLMGWDGLTSRSPQKMFVDGGIGAAVGIGAGFISGFAAQALYVQLVSSGAVNILVRGLGWAILGALMGLGLGIRRGPKGILNGVLGGVGGGFVAGALFQILGEQSTGGSVGPRAIGLTLTGIGIGLGIGLVTRATRDAWIKSFSGGPMQGKEFILQSTQTRIGSDYRCDMVLVKDQQVAPVHAMFVRNPDGTASVIAQSPAPRCW